MANGKYQQWLKKENLLLLEGWARDGLTDEQIVKNIGINISTLYDWKKKYPEISEALKKGKEVVDRMVENALLKRALGYSYIERTQIEDDEGKITTKEIEKHVIPDTTAQIFWLKNRQPKRWRDKQEVEQVNIATNTIPGIGNLSEDELRKLAKINEPEKEIEGEKK